MSDNSNKLIKSAKEIAEAITKLIMSFFKKKDAGGSGLVGIEELEDELRSHMEDTGNPMRDYANNNAKEFMESVKDFCKENNDKLMELTSKGKYGEIHEMITDGVANDIHHKMKMMNDLPNEIESNPNRRMANSIAEATSDLDSIAEKTGQPSLSDSMAILKEDIHANLDEPPRSQHERDMNVDYDKEVTRDPSPDAQPTPDTNLEM
jgi:hypothetical protein